MSQNDPQRERPSVIWDPQRLKIEEAKIQAEQFLDQYDGIDFESRHETHSKREYHYEMMKYKEACKDFLGRRTDRPQHDLFELRMYQRARDHFLTKKKHYMRNEDHRFSRHRDWRESDDEEDVEVVGIECDEIDNHYDTENKLSYKSELDHIQLNTDVSRKNREMLEAEKDFNTGLKLMSMSVLAGFLASDFFGISVKNDISEEMKLIRKKYSSAKSSDETLCAIAERIEFLTLKMQRSDISCSTKSKAKRKISELRAKEEEKLNELIFEEYTEVLKLYNENNKWFKYYLVEMLHKFGKKAFWKTYQNYVSFLFVYLSEEAERQKVSLF